MCRLTGCTVYDDIEFHGKMGRLTLSNEKILFQHTEDDLPARTWLWKSMKKCQAVISPEGKQIIKISNHQNKAVSFFVPESTLQTLQEDINKRLEARTAKSEAANTESDSSSEEANISSEGESPSDQTPPATPKTRRGRLRKGKSFDSEKEGSLRSNKKNGPAFGRSKTTEEAIPRRRNGFQRSKTVEDANARKNKVTIGRAAKVVAKDVFLKPGVQAVQDYVVNPTNNLILKPTNRNIVQPAKEKVVEPAAQMANDKIIKPTHNRIIKPTQRAATSVLGGQPKGGQEATNEAAPTEEQDSSSTNEDTTSGSTSNKKGVLRFLTAPLRRTKTVDETDETPSPVATTPEEEDANLVASSA